MMVFNHEVVREGTDDPSNVRHDPRYPEEVVGRAECLLAESGNEREEPATNKMKNWAIFTRGTNAILLLRVLTERSPSRD